MALVGVLGATGACMFQQLRLHVVSKPLLIQIVPFVQSENVLRLSTQ